MTFFVFDLVWLVLFFSEMYRTVISAGLFIFLIGIAAFGMWLTQNQGNESASPSNPSHAGPAAAPETIGDARGVSRSRRAAKRVPAVDPAVPQDLAVSEEIASKVDITDAEQERINTLVGEILVHRRQLFDELSRGNRTAEDVSQELGELRLQLNEDIRDLVGDERAAALMAELQRRHK